MTVSYEEFYKGRSFDVASKKVDVPFVVTGCFDENMARAVAQASSASFRSGLWRNNITATHEGNSVWKGAISYGQFQTVQGKWNLDFDTSGGTIRVTHSKAMRAKFGTDAPDTRAIGAHDGQVDGCDIVIPALKLTWSFNHPIMGLPMSRVKTLARYTGYVNSEEWMTFDANELLFIGCSGAMGAETETTVRYNFIYSENATGLTIGSIANIAKKGHDYLDVIWQDEVVSGKDVKTAKYVYTHRVYDETPFGSLLGF